MLGLQEIHHERGGGIPERFKGAKLYTTLCREKVKVELFGFEAVSCSFCFC